MNIGVKVLVLSMLLNLRIISYVYDGVETLALDLCTSTIFIKKMIIKRSYTIYLAYTPIAILNSSC